MKKLNFQELNNNVCDSLKKFKQVESIHNENMDIIIKKFIQYIDYSKPIVHIELNNNLEIIGRSNQPNIQLKIGKDGFWYASFLLEFIKKYDDYPEIKNNYAVIIGIKCYDNDVQLKIFRNNKLYRMNNDEGLLNFYDEIMNSIKEEFSIELMLKSKFSKLIGF